MLICIAIVAVRATWFPASIVTPSAERIMKPALNVAITDGARGARRRAALNERACVQALDSTMSELCLSLFPWTPFVRPRLR